MTRAFIVKVDVQTGMGLMDTAADITDALDKSAIPVISVVPWKGHGLMTEPIPPPITPPPLQ